MGLRGPKARPILDRFLEKVQAADSGCLEWIAGTNGVGYGVFHIGVGENYRKVYAHRWNYERLRGPIPDGLVIDHLCRNRACVNPDHLEPVTSIENVARGMGRPAVNARKRVCLRGHPLTGDNLYVSPSTGYRHCRRCAAINESKRVRNRRKGCAR